MTFDRNHRRERRHHRRDERRKRRHDRKQRRHDRKEHRIAKRKKFFHSVGQEISKIGRGIGKEFGNVLHTGEHLVDNLGKGAGGLGEGIGSGIKILSNPIILVGIGGIVLMKVIF